MIRVLSIICIVFVVVYDVFAIFYLFQSHEVVEGCSAEKGIVWPTTLWHYCLFSALTAPLNVFCVMRLPFRRATDAVELHMSRWRLDEQALLASIRDQDKAFMRYGITLSTPDWMFMAIGALLLLQALILGVLFYWGYSQLFLMKAECRDATVAFEELSLWKFGLFTVVCQACFGVSLFFLGMSFLAAPVGFELTLPPIAAKPAKDFPSHGTARTPPSPTGDARTPRHSPRP